MVRVRVFNKIRRKLSEKVELRVAFRTLVTLY